MSFFNEFFESISLDSDDDKIFYNLVLGVGVRIFGKLKIDTMQETEIILKSKKERIRIYGENLNIASMSKGEVEIEGIIQGVARL